MTDVEVIQSVEIKKSTKKTTKKSKKEVNIEEVENDQAG